MKSQLPCPKLSSPKTLGFFCWVAYFFVSITFGAEAQQKSSLHAIGDVYSKIDSSQNKSSQIEGNRPIAMKDSIEKILNLAASLNKKQSTLAQAQLDSLNNLPGINKIKSLTNQIQDSINQAKSGLQENISELNGQKNKIESAIPQLPVNGMAIPGMESSEKLTIPNLEGNETNKIDEKLSIENPLQVPNTNVPEVPSLDLNAQDPNLKKLTDGKLPTEEISNITNKVNAAEQKLEGVKKYGDEAKKIQEGGIERAEELPKEIENKIGEREEIKALNGETAKIKQYQSSLEKYKDQKLMKEELARNAKQLATDRINKFSPQFKQAQQQISRARKLNLAVKSFKDITKKRPNQMAGKPFRQRFIPGITLQFINRKSVTTDLGVQGSYKLSGRFTSGIGYVHRLSFSEKNINFIGSEGVSGYRVFLQFGLVKGLFTHGEFETLKLIREKQPIVFENLPSRVYGSYFGLGKKYALSKIWKGSLLGLYRVNYRGEVPGISKITMRMTFDLSLKKQKKPDLKLIRPITSSTILN